jgi:protein-S-isoprenylcysteine O-methyltransferase Ste14
VIAKTVNEEIQLFIASVSIRDSEVMLADSKIMREDSQIMKQQAARTTLLTTLAVIYLPLQLITGIFGMNIKEITGDGIPRWWACLAALGAGGVLTFLVYLAVKWWQWRSSQRKTREAEKDKEA